MFSPPSRPGTWGQSFLPFTAGHKVSRQQNLFKGGVLAALIQTLCAYFKIFQYVASWTLKDSQISRVPWEVRRPGWPPSATCTFLHGKHELELSSGRPFGNKSHHISNRLCGFPMAPNHTWSKIQSPHHILQRSWAWPSHLLHPHLVCSYAPHLGVPCSALAYKALWRRGEGDFCLWCFMHRKSYFFSQLTCAESLTQILLPLSGLLDPCLTVFCKHSKSHYNFIFIF